MAMNRKRKVKKTNRQKSKNLKMGIVITVLVLIVVIGVIYASTMSQESSAESWGDAPDFTLKTLKGDDFTLSDHLGKIIVIDLMASWCSWCKPQMTELEEVLEEKGNEVIIVSVDVEKGETRDDLERVFGDYLDKWTFVLDDYENTNPFRYA